MSHLTRLSSRFATGLMVGLAVVACAAADGRPPAEPAKIDLTVSPAVVAAGGEARLTLRVIPTSGVKINRYPKIKLSVDGRDGIVGAAEAAVGNDAPPPLDKPESNYFKDPEPLTLALAVDPAAPSGQHQLSGVVTYFYCVTSSGFCAPKKAPVKLTLDVR